MMHRHDPQSGSALIYILIAIALLAALTASFMQPGGQQASSQNIVKTVSDLKSQVEFIRSAVQECVLMYPGGDSNLIGQPNFPYPINPTSVDPLVRNIGCPGNPGDGSVHTRIFGGMTGKFLPPPPALFEEWEYHSGPDGVFFFTHTDKTDAYLKSALERLDEEFSQCEADIITGSMSSDDETDGRTCPSGSTCFRVWMITQPSSAGAYQTGGPEAAAGCPL